MKSGLSAQEARQRLMNNGPNEIPVPKSSGMFRILKEVLREPMFILLLSSATLYMILGDFSEGAILLSTISIIIAITFMQHRKTEKALEALRHLAAPLALVERDGIFIRIPSREIVVGDIVSLNEGDRIPSDGILIDVNSLEVDESVLTGEALALQKKYGDHIYGGTLVTRGRAIFEIESTGLQTEFGKIGSSLNAIQSQPTKLQSELGRFIKWLSIIGAGICVGVVLLFYFTQGHFIQALLNGLSAAMAILPEEFPVIMTVFLALGAWRLSKTNVLTRKSSAIETLGSATVLCSDKTGTITCNKMVVGAVVPSAIEGENRLMVFAKLACIAHAHDPMERAIHEYGTKDIHLRALSLEREYALSSKLTAMTLVYKESAGRIIATKGAPETLFHLCHLNEQEMKVWQEKLTLLARKGMRILGVAEGRIDSATLPETQEGFSFSFLGLVAFSDPVRQEVSDTINECRTAGIRIIMLTGDHPETAATIGSEIGLSSAELLIGSDIHALTDEQLRQRLAHTEIIARLKPEQKLRIVLALQASGEIVAMTGDGVNDAPALNIGVAMGLKGTDVAREASSLVLLDDNFNSIVRAIRSGRRIYDNLQKAMSYVLAIHIPIIGLTLLPAFVPSLALILLPLHIVFMELIIDPVSSIAFESEAEEKDIMKHPPRKSNTRFFGKTEITQSIVDGLLLLGCVLVVYLLSRYGERSELQLRSITFIALVTANLLMVLSKLSMTRSILYSFTSRNKSAKFIFLAAIILMIIVFCVPEISAIFHMTYPGHLDTFYAICAALVFTMCLEILKVIRRKKKSFVTTQNL